MRHLALRSAILSVLATAAACGPRDEPSEPRNVFGPDNRETPSVASLPYAPVGRLDSGCTGTLIGARLVLTAAHCVLDSATGAVRAEVGYFRPALTGGRSADPVWIDYLWIGSDKPESNRVRDWAVLRLERAPGEKYGRLAVHEVDFAAALPYTTSLIGYSLDRDSGNSPSLHRGCYVHEVSEGRLFHDCDATSGVSGGPLLASIGSVTHIVGMSVSEFRQGAEASVQRDGYTRDYANVAIPASSFAQAARTLAQTADAGIAAPRIDGVLERTNPNPRVAADGGGGAAGDGGGGGAGNGGGGGAGNGGGGRGDGGDGRGDGGDGRGDGGDGRGGGGYGVRDIRAAPQLVANQRAIDMAARGLQEAVRDVGRLALEAGATDYKEEARRMLRVSESFHVIVVQVARGPATDVQRLSVVEFYSDLDSRRQGLRAYAGWRQRSALQLRLDAILQRLDGAFARVEALVFNAS